MKRLEYLPLIPAGVLGAYTLINLPTHLYDKLKIGPNEIGYVSAAIISILFMYYYIRLKEPNILMRTLFSVLICATALMHYEIFWNFGWFLSERVIILDVLGFITCEAVLLWTFSLLRGRFKYPIPHVIPMRWVMVSAVMLISILWLAQTNFYSGWSLHYFGGIEDLNPHNLEWAVGKVVSLLSWLGVMKWQGS